MAHIFKMNRFESSSSFPSNVIKEETVNKNCYCCLADDNLKSIQSVYFFEGKPEVYSQMLSYCFSIELLLEDNKDAEMVFQICEICINRLREAYCFKNQIEAAQESLRSSSESKIEGFPEDSFILDKELYGTNTEKSFIESCELSNDTVKNENIDDEFKDNSLRRILDTDVSDKKKDKKRKIKNYEIPTNRESLEKFSILGNKNSDIILKKDKTEKFYELDKSALTCEICYETFPLHNLLVRHMPIHFPNFTCHICAKVFDSIRKLKCHLGRHNQSKQKCNICNKAYKGSENLRIHMRQHAGPISLYKCPQCPERFTVYYKRVKHLVEVHNDEPKKYKCKQCDKQYVQACTLKSHIKRVHLQERSCVCSECGDGFFDKSSLSEHMLKHNGMKTFKCDICHKSYGRRYTLKEHMRTHNNDKRFLCSFCGKAFTQKCTLKGHLKTHDKLQFSMDSSTLI